MNELERAFDQLGAATTRLKMLCSRAPMNQDLEAVLGVCTAIRAAELEVRRAAMKTMRKSA